MRVRDEKGLKNEGTILRYSRLRAYKFGLESAYNSYCRKKH